MAALSTHVDEEAVPIFPRDRLGGPRELTPVRLRLAIEGRVAPLAGRVAGRGGGDDHFAQCGRVVLAAPFIGRSMFQHIGRVLVDLIEEILSASRDSADPRHVSRTVREGSEQFIPHIFIKKNSVSCSHIRQSVFSLLRCHRPA